MITSSTQRHQNHTSVTMARPRARVDAPTALSSVEVSRGWSVLRTLHESRDTEEALMQRHASEKKPSMVNARGKSLTQEYNQRNTNAEHTHAPHAMFNVSRPACNSACKQTPLNTLEAKANIYST